MPTPASRGSAPPPAGRVLPTATLSSRPLSKTLRRNSETFTELAAVVRPDALPSNTSALPIRGTRRPCVQPRSHPGSPFLQPRQPHGPGGAYRGPHPCQQPPSRSSLSPRPWASHQSSAVPRPVFSSPACSFSTSTRPAASGRKASHRCHRCRPARLGLADGSHAPDRRGRGGCDRFHLRRDDALLPDRVCRTSICARLLAAFKGRKNGASSGFYTYANRQESLNPSVATLAPLARTRGKVMEPAAIVDRLMGVMIGKERLPSRKASSSPPMMWTLPSSAARASRLPRRLDEIRKPDGLEAFVSFGCGSAAPGVPRLHLACLHGVAPCLCRAGSPNPATVGSPLVGRSCGRRRNSSASKLAACGNVHGRRGSRVRPLQSSRLRVLFIRLFGANTALGRSQRRG